MELFIPPDTLLLELTTKASVVVPLLHLYLPLLHSCFQIVLTENDAAGFTVEVLTTSSLASGLELLIPYIACIVIYVAAFVIVHWDAPLMFLLLSAMNQMLSYNLIVIDNLLLYLRLIFLFLILFLYP